MKAPLLILLAGFASVAHADRLPLPADTPASYREECGSCHLPFPAGLLNARDWATTLDQLARHFGTDASLAPAPRREIARFLADHASTAAQLAPAHEAPRITTTARFVRKHREVPRPLWRDPRVRSAAHCEACHTGAAEGRFSEHDLALPELRR